MEEPTVTTYDSFMDVDARKEIGKVNLQDKGMVIAIRFNGWYAFNPRTKKRAGGGWDRLPPQFGRLEAFSLN